MLRKKDYDYALPKELIAQNPPTERGADRLLVYMRETSKILHRQFTDLPDFLRPGDILVFNDTKVFPARLKGVCDKGGAVEITLLKRFGDIWQALCKPGRKMMQNDGATFGGGALKCKVTGILDDGVREIKFIYDGIFEEILGLYGETPLPPYIKQVLNDKTRYQTVYARNDGAAASPTAGLHFTNEFINEINERGINTAFITLHIGLGTFRPVREDIITNHKMHEEWFCIEGSEAKKINDAKQKGGRLMAIGTTSVRTIETAADENGFVTAQSGTTDIFITPGYKFKATDALVTNFHLPESTLLMLVSAFAGRENILNAYAKAVENKYKFYSFGDAMLIM